VRDKGAAKWSPGRQGDVRDVWRTAALGGVGEDGEHDGSKVGRFVVCHGKEGREVRMAEVTGWINAFGTWTKERKGVKVVVALSNCVEMLACVFGMVPFPILFALGLGLSAM
jgi:hypothetical protein